MTERERERDGGGGEERTRVSKPEQTIHASPAGRLEYLETVLMICLRSLVLNGTFREFSAGFEELGIPRTGFSSLPPPSRRLLFSIAFGLSFCLSRSGFRADSIKRLFVAAKRRVKRFVRGASRSPLLLSRNSPVLSPLSPLSSSSLSSPFLFVSFRFLCLSFSIRRWLYAMG